MEKPKPLTDVEMCEILILEATNEQTKSKILGRMHFLLSLSSNKQLHEQFMGKYQNQEKSSEASIRILKGIMEEATKIDKSVEKPVVKKPKEK